MCIFICAGVYLFVYSRCYYVFVCLRALFGVCICKCAFPCIVGVAYVNMCFVLVYACVTVSMYICWRNCVYVVLCVCKRLFICFACISLEMCVCV